MLDVGRSVAIAVLGHRLRLTDEDVDLLAELLAVDGADASALSVVDITDTDPLPTHGFVASRSLAAARKVAAADTRPAVPPVSAGPEDDVDRVELWAAAAHSEVRGVWRAWRCAVDAAPWPKPKRVHVVECDAGADLPRIAAAVQGELSRAGDVDPQVEVYPLRAPLPSYQRLARGYGSLLWTREPDPGIRVAETGEPPDLVGRPLLDPPESGRVLRYLWRGEPVLRTPARAPDLLDPARSSTVPVDLRTDGYLVWSDAAAYYLRRYHRAPDPQLLHHIRRRAFQPPDVDGAAVHRALAALREPSLNAPAWIEV